MPAPKAQALITRLPYAPEYNAKTLASLADKIDQRGLLCFSIPIHVDSPNNAAKVICGLEAEGLTLVASISWYRDRHIVTTKSKRLTNTWEPIALFAQHKNYILNRESAFKIKKGFEGKESSFDEDEYLTCIGDHWPVRNDRRDRRFLPALIVLNCGQLADLKPDDLVFDPYGNPGVKDACKSLGWRYADGMLDSAVRGLSKSFTPQFEKESE